MKIKGKNNKAVIFLLLVTFLVWGTILYNVIKYYKSRGDGEVTETKAFFDEAGSKSSGNMSQVDVYDDGMKYQSLDYDPFRMEQAIPSESSFRVKKSAFLEEKIIPAKPRLNYRISGVIINRGNKLVVFEDISEGKTVFLREGEIYKDVIIESVLMDKVTLTDDGLTKEIMLQK